MKKLLLLPLLVFTGCLCDPDYCKMPDLLHPGYITEQQLRMNRFDPFTRSDIAPKIEGDRPSGCSQKTPAPQHIKEYEIKN